MDIQEKLEILSAAAKYDVSCSSSGSTRKNTPGGIGNAAKSGICHSWSEDGRCISLLKILLSNECVYDCAYCVNRSSSDVPRASFTPEEVAELTIGFYRRNYIEGLFLSSAVTRNPNHTMELMVKAVTLLRVQHKFNGYIHMKAIPGSDERLIQQAGLLVDRMSVNIELPSSQGLQLLAPQKNKQAIIEPMRLIGQTIEKRREERKVFRAAPRFVPAGQSTQLIIGATPDSDKKIIKLAEGLYHKIKLKRVYYSAYVPVVTSTKLPSLQGPPLVREHRLYQADWLLRFYGFAADELLQDHMPNLDLDVDPKTSWALRNLHLFPVEINTASHAMLLRIPGIGVRSAWRIMQARRATTLDFADLKKIGVTLKRAVYFITCKGKYTSGIVLKETTIRARLNGGASGGASQLSLFDEAFAPVVERLSNITGEL